MSDCALIWGFIKTHGGAFSATGGVLMLVVVRVWPPPNVRWFAWKTFKVFFFKFIHQATHQEMQIDPDYTDVIDDAPEVSVPEPQTPAPPA